MTQAPVWNTAPLDTLLEHQRQAFAASPYPSLEHRLDALARLKEGLLSEGERIEAALNQDYGQRSAFDTRISDLLPCVLQINYTRHRLRRWMAPSRRHAGLLLAPASVRVHHQPLGVVGIMVPWNFPVMLSIGPLITALAAGNRAMIKLSEFTPATNAVLRQLLAERFDEDEVAVVEGGPEVAAAFSALPLDHLIFTGSTAVGRKVMAAASQHLTPVTLELGGKSPCLIAPDMPLDLAVERIIYGKCLNAGQICVAPDYLLLPRGQEEALVEAFRRAFRRRYPEGLASPDYTSVINQAHYQRLTAWLEEASAAGAEVASMAEPGVDPDLHRMVPHLLWNLPERCALLEQEIFGPLLPIIPYDTLEQALDYIRARPRPLACYLMSLDEKLTRRMVEEVHAGGMAINETVFHVAADDAPFGGIGPSGMGHYHGHEGFLTFSKAKTVLRRGRFSTGGLVHPPYGWVQRLMLRFFMR
ncbi:aldehyde dehydrogenase [Aeromonas diversa CDC 2478-85]|uniref:Aldehyde dehydrogenase n=1 Tax=Aeromonas diversa CDC 2478-85 TaxID=1268237 RepID=N9VE49_9GAMM|nr:coniferyl aldehyde dehydrogenase [Aeromonas diversa]ENY73532.1 aldehyde dehydrogenase [Aeromonas diversa CDC 2478-85]